MSPKKPQDPSSTETTRTLLKRSLKILLYRLAAESEAPSRELESILQDVINELYQDAKAALAIKEEDRERRRSLLRVVGAAPAGQA